MPQFLSKSDVDATGLRSSFVNYLQNQTIFNDYDFEGSNISVLIDLLMQNTLYNNHYLNMVGAESFLDSAELRESIVSRAKELNYVPKSRTSSRSTVNVTISPGDSPNSITIPKGYAFTSIIDSKRLNFITEEAHVLTRTNGVYNLTGIDIFEGETIQEFFDVVSASVDGVTSYTSKFNLQSENIDANSIEVYVTINGTRKKWKKAESLYDITALSEVFFTQGYKDNYYEIIFGNGTTGRNLSTGDIVEIFYRDTVGSGGNNINGFDFSNSIDGYGNITVITEISSYGGSERESNENIKFKAPRHFTTQERGVIADDYTNLVLINFPEIEAVNSYGGEKVNKFGKQIIVLKPYDSTTVSETLSGRIKTFLEEKSLADEVIIENLEFFYIEITSDVKYNKDDTILNEAGLKTIITQNLVDLNTTRFNKFNQNVYSSQIAAIIDNSDDSIISNSTFLRLGHRLTPVVNVNTSYIFDFENKLDLHTPSQNAGHDSTISSSTFTYTKDDVDYDSCIEDDGNGVLKVYTTDNTGTSVALDTIGSVDYETGKIVFNLAIKGYIGYISLFASIKSRDLEVTKNKFIIIDSSDFNITMVETNA